MGAWGCPHEDRGHCRKLGRECDPGITGCVLHGRAFFPNRPEKNATPEEAERARRRVAKRRRGR